MAIGFCGRLSGRFERFKLTSQGFFSFFIDRTVEYDSVRNSGIDRKTLPD